MTTVLYLSRNDGTDMRVAKECATLTDAGAEVVFVGWDWGQSPNTTDQLPDEVERRIFRTGSAGRSAPLALAFARFAVQQVRTVRPDSVHAVNEEMLLLAAIARLLGPDHYLVGDLFDSQLLRLPTGPVGWLMWSAARLALLRADRLIVTDHARLSALPANMHPKASVVANLPVDPGSQLAQTEPDRQEPTIFVGGSLSADRGVDKILEAVRRIPGGRIIAAGWLYDEAARRFVDAPEVDYRGIVSASAALRLAARCHLVFGHYAPSNRNNRMASPNKLYDALSIGRPLLLNSEVEVSQWLLDCDGGAATPYGDVDCLVAAIHDLVDPIDWSRRRAQMRKLFETGYSWSSTAPTLLVAHGIEGQARRSTAAPISLVTTLYGGSGVGGHTFVEHLRAAKDGGRLDVHFVTSEPTSDAGATPVALGWPMAALPGKWVTLSIAFRRALAQRHRTGEAVWFNNAMLAFASLIRRPRSLRSSPMIGMVNDYENAAASPWSSRPRTRKFWWLVERYCARRLDLVVANSCWMADYLISVYGLDAERVRVLYKAVDGVVLGRQVPRVGHRPDGRTIGYLKWDADRGRLADLIEALPLLPDDVSLAAGGPEGVTLEPYRRLAARLGVTERVRFLGTIDRREVGPFMASLDLFVNPARDEALGVSLLEAMALGTPVLGRDVGGIPEVLDRGRAGRLFEGGVESLATAIAEVLDDGEGTRQRAKHARRHVEGFSPEAMVERMQDLTAEAALARSIDLGDSHDR